MESTGSGNAQFESQPEGNQGHLSNSNPRQKRDISWKYVTESRDASGKKTLTCEFCHASFKGGGINRMKQHLAGTKGNVVSCKKVTADVRFMIQGSLKENIERAKERRGVIDVDEFEAYDDDDSENMHTPTQRTGGGQKVGQSSSLQKRKATSPLDNLLKRGTSDPSQPSIKACLQSKEKWHDTDLAIAMWFYDSCIPLNAVNSQFFSIAMSKVAAMGHGYTGPSYHALRVSLLQDAKKQVGLIVDSFRSTWIETGCTIMGDGWKDSRKRQLINFLVYCPTGISFIKSVDASGIETNAENLCNLFAEIVEMVGPNNVIHLVTDNASNYKAAGHLLSDKYPSIIWSPCAAHCINLIMKDIGELSHVKDLAILASKITCFVYNNKWPLNWLRKREGWREILRPGDTRFATTFIALKSLNDHKDDLQVMVTSQDFKKYLKKDIAKEVKQIVLDERFWNNCNITVRIGSPLLRLLRICDSDEKPALGYVYEGMHRARKGIMELFRNNRNLYKPYVDIIDQRWDRMLRKSLHAAAYYLNPAFQYDRQNFCENPEIMNGLLDIIDKKVGGANSKIYDEISLFRDRLKSFSRPAALTTARSTRPDDWWKLFGTDAPNLRKLAIKILSQTASSSGCERNWCVFERIHTSKRNKLEHSRLNDLVYIHYNLRLQNRVKYSKRPYDPVDYESIDKMEFWVMEETTDGELDYDELENMLEEETPRNLDETNIEQDKENDVETIADREIESFARQHDVGCSGSNNMMDGDDTDDDWS